MHLTTLIRRKGDGVKIQISPKLEDGGYRVHEVCSQGFVSNTIDIKAEELKPLMSEICESDDELLDTLRTCYQLFDPKSITVIKKEEL